MGAEYKHLSVAMDLCRGWPPGGGAKCTLTSLPCGVVTRRSSWRCTRCLGASCVKACRPRGRGADRRGGLPDMTPILKRPAEVAGRQVPGRWEGDFIKGAGNRSAAGILADSPAAFVSWPGWTAAGPRPRWRASPANSGASRPA
jgi:hypothetical protein